MYARLLLEAAIDRAKKAYSAAKQNGKPLPDRRGLAVYYVKCELAGMRKQCRYDLAWECYRLLEAMRLADTLTSLLEALVAAEEASPPDGPDNVIPGQNTDYVTQPDELVSKVQPVAHIYNDAISAEQQDTLAAFVGGSFR